MKKKFYLWVRIFLLVCLATAYGKEETRTETVDAGNFDVNILRNEFLNGVFEDDVDEEQKEISLEELKEREKLQEQYRDYRELLQEQGYFVTEDSYIKNVTELETNDYYGFRIWVDYLEGEESSDTHKEDYFFFYEKESEELFQILYFDAEYCNVGKFCGFEEHFEDITFDGKEDLLISKGDFNWCEGYQAYVWTEDGFEYIPFGIDSYRVDKEDKTIWGTNKSKQSCYRDSGYRYEENRFVVYYYSEIEAVLEGHQEYLKKIREEDTETDTYISSYFKIEVQRLQEREKRYGYMGSVYEIRLYPSGSSQEMIQSFRVIAEEELEVSLKDLNHDGYAELILLWKQDEYTKNEHYDIFFWKDDKFETDSYIEDFIYNGYFGEYEVPFFPEKLYLKGEYESFPEKKEETLFYFQEDGKYVPVRSVFYVRNYHTEKLHATIIDYSEGEEKILYDEKGKEEKIDKDRISDIFWGRE